MTPPQIFSALPPQDFLMRLALKLFRGEPAISGFDWNFSPTHSSSPPFSTDVCSALHCLLLQLPPGHGYITRFRVSRYCLDAQLTLAFTSAPCQRAFNLAGNGNSPDRSTKSTRSHINYSASTACKHRVSGSLSLPSRGPFHLSFTVLCAIGH